MHWVTADGERILSVHSAAIRLGVSDRTVRLWARTGRLRGFKEGPKIWRFRETEVEAALDALLEDIFRMEPQALATGKRLVLSCAAEEDGAVLDDAAESLVELLRRPQAREGIAACKAKRAPSWARRDDA